VDFKLDTPFMEAFEELDKLNEATDLIAGKRFWAAAKANQIDAVAFHAAYDDELKELGLTDIFTADGALANKGVYGRIKAAKEANPDSWAVKALSRLWALRYVDNVKFPSELAADKAAADKAAAERAQQRAAQRRQEEEASKAAKEAKLQECQELLKTYIGKVATEIVTAYEQAAGISALDGVTLISEGEEPGRTWRDAPISKFGVHYKGWNRYYPITETKLLNEAFMLNLLAEGFIKVVEYINLSAATEEFKKIDIFANNKYAEAILLGESGTIYNVSVNSPSGLMISTNGEKAVQAYKITEPYEVIYTQTYWSDGNNRTTRDAKSMTYYSWNSKHADKLGKKIPTEFGRVDTYLGGYTDTKQVTNPLSSNFSHVAGIDSWATMTRLVAATD
jgi:hypothetical protein